MFALVYYGKREPKILNNKYILCWRSLKMCLVCAIFIIKGLFGCHDGSQLVATCSMYITFQLYRIDFEYHNICYFHRNDERSGKPDQRKPGANPNKVSCYYVKVRLGNNVAIYNYDL